MKTALTKQLRKQSGLSMIELMIAMVIGLIITAATLQVFVGSRITYSTQTGLAKLQENGRFAMTYLTRDIRQAGFQGCSRNNSVANTLVSGGVVNDFVDLSNALTGLNNVDGMADYGGKNPIVGSDVITMKFADTSNSCTIDSHVPASATLHCQDNHIFKKDDVLIVSDCEHTAVFQQSNTNNNGNVSTVVHNKGQSTPGNCTKGLGLPVDCSSTNGTPYTFPPGASVMKMVSYRYFIADNAYGEQSLYRQGLNDSTGTASATDPVELVEGIDDMQILYGVDTDSDGVPDKYVDATEASADMGNVISVRVSLLVLSNEENIVRDGQTLTYNGATPTFSDGRLRKVFTNTIAIRNRL